MFLTGPITADSAGNIYYNTLKLNKKALRTLRRIQAAIAAREQRAQDRRD